MNKKIWSKTIKIATPVLLISAFAIYKYTVPTQKEAKSDKKDKKEVPVIGYTVKSNELISDIQAVGTLRPNEEVDLIAETAGKVVGIYFKESTPVKKGDLLLKVDDADLQAQLQRAQHQYKLLSERLRRQRILYEKDAVSREEFDQVQTDYNIIETDIALLKVKIAKTELRAPFSGIIGFRYVSLGAYLQPNTVVSHLVDDALLKVEFSIPEKYAAKSLLGAKVRFETESSSKPYYAQVYAIDPQVDVKTRTILLRAKCENTGKELSSGMFARIYLITGRSAHTMLIPTEAIVPEMEGKRVWKVQNGKAVSVAVEAGTRTEDMIEIVSGVQPGDTILTTGLMQVREGSAIKLSKVL